MRVCVFEDHPVSRLAPLTLTRPAFELWCGASSLLQRHCHAFAADELAFLVRPLVAGVCAAQHPTAAVNDPSWFRDGPAVLVNARWLAPAEPVVALPAPGVGMIGPQVAYVRPPADELRDLHPEALDERVEAWKDTLPRQPAGGWMIDYPWNLVERNTEALGHTGPRQSEKDRFYRPAGIAVIGPSERLFVDSSAEVEPLVAVDTRKGPVVIDREVLVRAFSRLEGPCYIGPKTWVLGAKVSGSTIGPVCRIGGEVEGSIVHGHSNKAHEGFLGHSYVGEWVNLAAGTQISDLRNDYKPVVMTADGEKVNTGMIKVGSFFGDHTKTGINTLLNTGTTTGVFCYVLPSNLLPPRYIPSFCGFARGMLEEVPPLERLLDTAAAVMKRRGIELSPAHATLFERLRELTDAERQRALQTKG